jgi:demethylmenaquinone methyltransferase/2-methoxy-6-polyprenyl-1,4-benzoquinol methylase
MMTKTTGVAGAMETKRPETDDEVWTMFDRIAPRYDLLNRLLSFRRDVAWRKGVARHVRDRSELDVLDLATGTGDQILHLIDGGASVRSALGLDMAEDMLTRGRAKIEARRLQDRISLCKGDAADIPCEAESFDLVTISFGIRNVGAVPIALSDMLRVTRPAGRILILEFSMPTNTIMRPMYLFYLRHVLPSIGGLISGDAIAYRYLNRTIETFPCGEAFCALMRTAGMVNVEAFPLTFGIATIYKGDKAPV